MAAFPAALHQVEDHFALDRSPIQDLEVTDHVVLEECPPSPLARAVKCTSVRTNSTRDIAALSKASRARHGKKAQSPADGEIVGGSSSGVHADDEIVGSSSSVPRGGEGSSSGSFRTPVKEPDDVADRARHSETGMVHVGSLYLPASTPGLGQKYVRRASSSSCSTQHKEGASINTRRVSGRVVSFANGGVMFRPPSEPSSSPDVQLTDDAQEQPEGSGSSETEGQQQQQQSSLSPATEGPNSRVASMPKKRRQQQQRKQAEGTEDGGKAKTVKLPPPPEGKCPHFFCI